MLSESEIQVEVISYLCDMQSTLQTYVFRVEIDLENRLGEEVLVMQYTRYQVVHEVDKKVLYRVLRSAITKVPFLHYI